MTKALTTTAPAMRQIKRELERDPRLKSANTQRGYLHDLKQFETWRAGRPMTRLLVEQYAAELLRVGRAPSSINRVLASVRWWARRLADLAYEDRTMDRAEREEITTQAGRVATVGDVKGERAQKGRHLASGELKALMDVCADDDTAAGVRDAAVIALAWAGGLRRSELAGLQLEHYKPTSDEEADLIVHGKGDKVRLLYLYNGAAAALAEWVAIRGADPGPLFYAIRKGGRVQTGRGVGDESLAQMLAKRAEQAGVNEITWHDFRRTFAGNLLDNGADLVTVQKLMGHSSPATTSAYDRRGEEVKRRAVRSLHVPYTRRRRPA